MIYELAKQLKDAGLQDHTYCSKCKDWGGELIHDFTLTELIKACGKITIHIWNNENIKNSWKAKGSTTYLDGFLYQIEDGCSTPEEAVAELWLELNKK